MWKFEVPAESTVMSRPRSLATCFRTASPTGERQMLPRQTTRTETFCSDMVATLSENRVDNFECAQCRELPG